VSDAADDPSGPDDPGVESTGESLGSWEAPAAEPAWTDIDVDPESAGLAGSSASGAADATDGSEGHSGRLRRPSSLRSAVEGESGVPRRKLTPPPFPKPPKAAPTEAAGPSSPAPKPADTVSPPVDRGPSAVARLTTLVSERPEVGVGIAFFGGLVLASILKRLAR
jgi:hypothetical protein